jgi:hypothetical protein
MTGKGRLIQGRFSQGCFALGLIKYEAIIVGVHFTLHDWEETGSFNIGTFNSGTFRSGMFRIGIIKKAAIIVGVQRFH